MRIGYSQIFWGFIFIMLSFRIQGVDILPDFIGYIFLLLGLSNLHRATGMNAFRNAFNFAIPLLILSLFEVYQTPPSQSGIQVPSGLQILLFLLQSALSIGMVVYFCGGTRTLALERLNTTLARVATNRSTQYVIFTIVSCISSMFLLQAPLLVLAVLVYALVMVVLMLTFVHRSGQELV